MGCDDQSLAVRFPAYTASTTIPETWMETAEQNRTVFKMRSSHWAFNLVANLAYARWAEVMPVVQQRIVSLEAKFAEDLRDMDIAAIDMLKQNKPVAEVVAALTNFTVETGDGLIDDCKWIILAEKVWHQDFRQLALASLPLEDCRFIGPPAKSFMNWTCEMDQGIRFLVSSL